MLQVFSNQSGKIFGDWVERKLFPKMFSDISLGNGSDFSYKNLNIEVKGFRATSPSKKGDDFINVSSYSDRALFSKDEQLKGLDKNGNTYSVKGSFQQIKPKQFDYLFGFVFFADVFRLYVIPSRHINPTTNIYNDKQLKLNPQHGNINEGTCSFSNIVKHNNNQFFRDEFDSLDVKLNIDRYI